MFRHGRALAGALASLAIAGIGVIAVPQVALALQPLPSTVVISEVFGGGGNSGAPLNQDFVELYNRSASSVDVTGWSVQYKGATNGTWTGKIDLTGSIAPGGFYVVGAGTGANGSAIAPPPNVSNTAVAMSANNGNVALVSSTTTLTCLAAACSAPTETTVQDLVAFGTGDTFAGTAATPALTNTTSASRAFDAADTQNNASDFGVGAPTPWSLPPEPPDPTPYTIAEIQGPGFSTPHPGELAVTEGVVTAAYPVGGFNGFVIQTEGTGGLSDLATHTTSDAISVVGALPADAVVGDLVEVIGTVAESSGLTRITASAGGVTELPGPVDPVTPVTAPWPATSAARETIESMLYTPQGDWTVSETFPTNQYGEVGLAQGDAPLMQPSDRFEPGTAGFDALEDENYAKGVTLDDGSSTSYLTSNVSAAPFVAADGTFRVGSSATFHTNVIVDYQFGAWRFQPLAQVTTANDQDFVTFAGSRPPTPDETELGDGEVKIATFNVLNYFTTGGAEYEAAHPPVDCSSFNDRAGTPIGVNRCQIPGTPPVEVNGPRGAWDDVSLDRQQDKTVAAINALDADVVGLMEMENSANMGETVDEATDALVDALNLDAGSDVWAFIPSSAEFPAQPLRDVITVAIIYKPAAVTPLGASKALGTLSDAGQAFDNAREPMGQAFTPVGGGDPFFVAVNHFKSKGCDSPPLPVGDPNADSGDGQSCYNGDRVEQANALTAWVDTVLPSYTSPAVTDAYLLGDFNAYTEEDPMHVFYDAGYVDLNKAHGNEQQSYNFDGLNGSLDHILANESAYLRVTGSQIWNINAPESLALEYSRFNYTPTNFYSPDPFRSSDHDPEIAAITADAVVLPAAPVINSPVTGATLTVGDVVLTGTAPIGATVEVFDGATSLGLSTAIGTTPGTWTFQTAALTDGPHTFTATATVGGLTSVPSNAVTVTTTAPPAGDVNITLVSINDFHGRIDANTVKWAGTVEQIVGSAGGDDVAVTGAGDLVGASVFASASQNDQPTIDVMNAVGLDASAVGNHEFDKGWPDLRDRILGGDPFDPDNAHWDYLGANVYDSDELPALVPLLPEYSIITINGVDVAVIGAVTEQTPSLVSPGGMVGVTIGDPVEAVNRVAGMLTNGIDTPSDPEADVLVATFHEGAPTGDPTGTLANNKIASPVFAEIVDGLAPSIDVIFNGHTHQKYAYDAPVTGGDLATRPVLQTGQYGENVGKVVLTVDATTHEVEAYTMQNVARTTVADATLVAQYPSLQTVKTITDAAIAQAAIIGDQPKGTVTADITTGFGGGTITGGVYGNTTQRDDRAAESTLGNVVADALVDVLSAPQYGAAEIGIVNPGGLRDELRFAKSGPELVDGVVRYAEANAVLPFVNNLWTTTLTGAQFKTMLEQQWQQTAGGVLIGGSAPYLQLGVSSNVSYTYDPARPLNDHITSITINGQPYDPATSYRIGTFSFLATGGDNFHVFRSGTNPIDTGLVDRDAWIDDYIVGNSPLSPDYVRRSAVVSPTPTAVTTGSSLVTTLANLDFTSLGAPENTSVDVAIGGVPVGSVPVAFVAAPTYRQFPTAGASGVADVNLTVPAAVPAGPQTLTFTVQPSGKVISLPVIVTDGVIEPEPPVDEPIGTLDPQRILDTRPGASTYDGLFQGIGIRSAGTTLELEVIGRAGVPADAKGVVLNVTATGAEGVGYVTVWPCGQPQPTASSLNFDPSASAPNAVLTAFGDDGTVCLFTAESSVHLIADVNGFIPADSGFEPVNPARLADSRDGASTIDGEFLGAGPRGAGSIWAVDIAGRGGVAADAGTASLNVTATGGSGTGYITVWPCDATQPTASSLNFTAGQNVPNAVITKLAADGTVCIFVAEASAHVVVDVNGYFEADSGYGALNPARLLDTRNAPTVDGAFTNLGPRQPGEVLELDVAGRGGVPDTATGVALNVTATGATGTGYVTVWPCNGAAPNVSTVNFIAGVTRANASIAQLSDEGTICLVVMEATSDLIVDVTGYLG